MDKAPDAYRTISEVGEDLDLPQHVLRFWETRFPQIKPLKRGGGRRYYRPDDVELLKGIRHLLYKEGYTIKGVQRILKEQGARAVMAWARPVEDVEEAPLIAPSLPTPVAPPPAYAPPPPPVMSAPLMAPPAPEPVYAAPPVFVPPPAPAPAVAAPLFGLPGLAMPPLVEEPAAVLMLERAVEVAPAAPAIAALVEAQPQPSAAPQPSVAPPQVSMFRGGLQRAEVQPEAVQAPHVPPSSVSYGTSAYPAPLVAPPGQARTLLVQALEELSGARVVLDRLLATRAGHAA